jgi:Alternative oxidase
MFFFSYLISPTYCHRMVGYLEEEAVRTYTHLIKDIDEGKLPEWAEHPVPEIAINYWHLNSNATIRDLVLVVRADEACHSHVNHTFAGMKSDETNPFSTGAHQVP